MSYNLEQRGKKYGEQINIFDSEKILGHRWRNARSYSG